MDRLVYVRWHRVFVTLRWNRTTLFHISSKWSIDMETSNDSDFDHFSFLFVNVSNEKLFVSFRFRTFRFSSAGFYLFPQCQYVPCVPCTAYSLKLMIVWQAFSFYIPMLSLVVLTIILIIRVNRSRQQLRPQLHQRSRSAVKITIQLCIYICWSLIYYCPPAFYSLVIAIDAKKYSSPVMRSISTMIGVVGIQIYPILTYVMFWGTKQERLIRVQPR